jgi:hypothetical protein
VKRLTRIKILVACAVSLSVALVAAVWPASGYRKHLCGVYGTKLKPQEWCPGISPPKKWKRVVGYRNSGSGISMCVIINSRGNRYLFSRCSDNASSIYIRPRDLENGRRRTRAYNKNNNVAYGVEKRYLYATTGRN